MGRSQRTRRPSRRRCARLSSKTFRHRNPDLLYQWGSFADFGQIPAFTKGFGGFLIPDDRSQQELLDLVVVQEPPLPHLHVAEGETANFNAAQEFDAVAELQKHETDLAFQSLGQHHFDAVMAKFVNRLRLGIAMFNQKAFKKAWHEGEIKILVQFHMINFGKLETRVGQLLGQFTTVGQNEEAFAVHVEAAHIKKTGSVFRQQVEHCFAAPLGIAGTEHAFGLEHGQSVGLVGLLFFSINADVVVFADRGGEVSDQLAVDGDTSGADKILTGSAGAETGTGEITIETHKEKSLATNRVKKIGGKMRGWVFSHGFREKKKPALAGRQAFQKSAERPLNGLFFGAGLGQIVDGGCFVFPDSTLFEEVHAFKTLEDIPFNDNLARAPEAFVL